MKLLEILKDSSYKLTQFSDDKIKKLEKSVYQKEQRVKSVPAFFILKMIVDIL